MKKILFGVLAFILSFEISFAIDFPEYQNFVNDYTATLAEKTVDGLNERLKNYEAETGTEIAVAMISSTEGVPIVQYATGLGNEWGVGKEEADNGVIFVIAKDDRELFIASGNQTEGALTDAEINQIVQKLITPRFQEGNFDEGVVAGVSGIISAISGESFSDLRMENGEETEVDIGGIIFFAVFFVFPWLAAILGRSKRIWPGAVIGGVGGGVGALVLSFALWGIAAAVVGMGALGLFFDWSVSRNYQKAAKRGGNIAWWAGGGRGGSGGFGGGGFGGFGGGGFSGGGFGGKW